MATETSTTSLFDRAGILGTERINALKPGIQASPRERPWAPAEAGPAFATGSCWTQCTFYVVNDVPAEVGFYCDVLGLTPFVMGRTEAMFTNEQREYYIGVRQADADHVAVDPNSVRVQFMVADIEGVVAELEARGIAYEQRPAPTEEGSPMWFGTFRSPHGVYVDLWGMTE